MSMSDLQNCLKPAAAAASIPPWYYTAHDSVNAEIGTFFRGSWIGVGRSDIVQEPGDFVALDVAGQNILLLRDKQGDLRAFANSCRHRGARLVDGSGSCRGLRCPFHSWFYGLDGTLISAPKMEAAENFDTADFGLIPYRADERLGFVFICLSPTAADLDSFLGDFATVHAPWPMTDLVTVRRQEMTANCNWKMFLEVFNEYYHLPFVHADSIDSLYASPDPAQQFDGAFASQFGSTEGTGGLLEGDQQNALPTMPGLTGYAATGARYTWVFPNMTFAANNDALWCYEAYPLGPARCKIVQSACFPHATTQLPDFAEKLRAYLARLDAALDEDLAALENQQSGMACPDAMQGRFQPDLEANVASFAHWYAQHIDQTAG